LLASKNDPPSTVAFPDRVEHQGLFILGKNETFIIIIISFVLSGRKISTIFAPGVGWGVLPNKRLMGMCRWIWSHFHHWFDYRGVAAFSIKVI